VHGVETLQHIGRQFEGHRPRPTGAQAAEGLADSYIYALHSRLAQLYSDAVHGEIVTKVPCSRRTSPKAGKQRPFVCTTEQLWKLHDAMPEHLRPAILLGAFVGLRLAETCGLRVHDVDLVRGIVHPTLQHPADPLKSETSRTSVPIPQSLARQLKTHVEATGAQTVLVDTWQHQLAPWSLERAIRAHREAAGMPDDFRYHDLRHYFASMLIASGADVKVVQARLRHASAKTTLDTYSHLWPDADESAKAAVDAVLAERSAELAAHENPDDSEEGRIQPVAATTCA